MKTQMNMSVLTTVGDEMNHVSHLSDHELSLHSTSTKSHIIAAKIFLNAEYTYIPPVKPSSSHA
jgi:hypothetical protein